MIPIVIVAIRSPSVPERLGARGQQVYDLVDCARLHPRLERPSLDGALAQREIVGEQANVLAQQLIESSVLRAGPGGHHPVLDEEERDFTTGFSKLSRESVELGDVSRLPGALGLNQQVFAHARALLSVAEKICYRRRMGTSWMEFAP